MGVKQVLLVACIPIYLVVCYWAVRCELTDSAFKVFSTE